MEVVVGCILAYTVGRLIWLEFRRVKLQNQLIAISRNHGLGSVKFRLCPTKLEVLIYNTEGKLIGEAESRYKDLRLVPEVLARGGKSLAAPDAWVVLGIMPTKDSAVVEQAFRRMAKVYHPDVGGNSSKFQMLESAKAEALRQCR